MKITILSIFLFVCCSGSFAQSQAWRYSGTPGGIYAALNINMDVNNYLYVGGPGIDTLDPFQPSASLVFKLDSAGNYYWNQGFIDDEGVTYDGMAGDHAGNSYLFGEYYTNGIQWFNGFLTRVDSSGNLVWTKHYDYEDYYDAFQNAIVDNNGNVLVAGTSDDSFGNQNMISIKYPPADTVPIYSERLFDSTTFYYSYFAQTDYAGGQYSVGQAPIYDDAGNSMILLKYNSTGGLQWERIYNSTPYSDEEPASTNVDSAGNLFIADNTAPDELNYNYVPYLLKVNLSGATVWQREFTDITNNYNLTCSALDTSYFYIGGSRNDSIFIGKVAASNGGTIWEYAFDGRMGIVNKIIAINDTVYATGILANPLGGSEFFTAKLSAAGALQWFATYQDAMNGPDGAYSLTGDNSGGIYVAGQSFEAGNDTNGSATVIKYHDNGLPCSLTIDSITSPVLTSNTADNGLAIAYASGGTMPYVYHWSNNGATDTISGLSSGLYCLTITDAHSCEAIGCDSVAASICKLYVDSATVSYISYCYPTVNAIITVGDTGNIGASTYSIDSGVSFHSGNVFGNLTSGNYYVAAKDAYGCIAFYATNPVNVPPAVADTPTLHVTGDTLSTGTYSKYDWFCGNTGTFVGTNQSLTPSDSICGKIYVEVTDTHGCIYNSSSVDIACVLGVNSLSEPQLTLTVYPNPFGDHFNVKVDGNPNSKVEVALFDLYGQKLYDAQPAGNVFSIPASGLAQGIYLLRLQAGQQLLYQQVIKAGE